MLYAGLDLSRKRLDCHLLDAEGATIEVGTSPPDNDDNTHNLRRRDRRAYSPAARKRDRVLHPTRSSAS